MIGSLDRLNVDLGNRLPEGFLGKLVQISMVTRDIEKTAEGFLKLGIGPWKIYRFDSDNCLDRRYMGEEGDFVFLNALADMPGLMWELVQPLGGRNIYSDFMDRNDEGLHHLLFDCNSLPWDEQNAALISSGYKCIQSAKWSGTVSFAYYATDSDDDVIIEIMNVGKGAKRPEPVKIVI